MYKNILLVVTLLSLIGCSSSRSKIVTTKGKNSKHNTASRSRTQSSNTTSTSNVVNDYIFEYKNIAMSNMKNFGIPASIILAQGILESGAGKSRLATEANNHFGIKCYTDWKGETIHHDDDANQECFRKYNDPEQSYQDHADILSQRSRYASLFKLSKGDYEGWAKGLKAAGYATDPKYPAKLISYIETYHLDEYDKMVLGRSYVIDSNQKGNYNVQETRENGYEVEQGDTLYSISKKFNTTVEELKEKNKLLDNAISTGQIILIK